jgi:hypothetical protein
MHQDIANHDPVYKFFLTAAENLQEACQEANITSGAEPIDALTNEILSRWSVMSQVVDDKQQKLEIAQKQLQSYKEHVRKMSDLLLRTEEVLQQQGNTGVDLEQAKANRDTLMVRLYTIVFVQHATIQ